MSNPNYRTLNVNFYAAPQVGKSATANRLVALLTLRNVAVEFVPEYSKELHFDGRLSTTEQLVVTAEQWRRQSILQNKVQVAVVDSAVRLGAVYAPASYREELLKITDALTKDWWSLDVLLERESLQNPMARQKQAEILQMLRATGRPYVVEQVNETVAARLAERIGKMLAAQSRPAQTASLF